MVKRRFVKRQSLAGNMKYRGWKQWAEGDVAIGEVVGFFVDSFEKKGVKLKIVEATFEDGSEDDYVGKVMAINSMGAIEDAIETVEVGMLVQIEYTGETEVQKGKFAGKECHTVNFDIVAEESEEDGQAESSEEDV